MLLRKLMLILVSDENSCCSDVAGHAVADLVVLQLWPLALA